MCNNINKNLCYRFLRYITVRVIYLRCKQSIRFFVHVFIWARFSMFPGFVFVLSSCHCFFFFFLLRTLLLLFTHSCCYCHCCSYCCCCCCCCGLYSALLIMKACCAQKLSNRWPANTAAQHTARGSELFEIIHTHFKVLENTTRKKEKK